MKKEQEREEIAVCAADRIVHVLLRSADMVSNISKAQMDPDVMKATLSKPLSSRKVYFS